MIRLRHSHKAWGRDDFQQVLKRELESLPAEQLPLQQGLSLSSRVSDSPFNVIPLDSHEEGGTIQARVGVFYTGIIAGCSCADDPTPQDEQTEYCVLALDIDRRNGEASISLTEE